MPHLPPGYSARPMRVEDAADVTDMLNIEATAATGEPQFSAQDYAVDLQEPGVDLEEQSRVVLAPDGSVAGIAEIYTQAPHVHPFCWIRIHPDHCGRGLGWALTEWAESYNRARVHLAPAHARVSILCNAYTSNQEAQQLLSDLGFTQVRIFHTMRIEFHGPPPEPRWPEGLWVRTLVPGEDDWPVYRAMKDAFSDHWGHTQRDEEADFARWKHHIFAETQFDPSLHFLALDGEEIAGISLCSPPQGDGFDVGWVSQLGVRKPWRQRGLAQALLLHTFGEFYRRGTMKVGLGVDSESLTGATRLYEKVGMFVHSSTVSYEKELRSGEELATRSLE